MAEIEVTKYKAAQILKPRDAKHNHRFYRISFFVTHGSVLVKDQILTW